MRRNEAVLGAGFVLGRIILGGIFVWSGVVKVLEPVQNFEAAIIEYQILPDALIRPFALSLPWVEIIIGVFIVLGWMFRWSVLGAMGLLGVFMIAIVSTTLREIPLVSCGCLGSSFSLGTKPHEVFWKDLILLAIGYFLLKTKIRPWLLDQVWKD